MPNYEIDIRSDTVSLPTDEMREAMAKAIVGDDVYGEDPTIKHLERKSAELFGKEAALFVPSGTMANLLAIMVHCNRRGSEAIVGDLSHTFLYEQGGASQIAGVQLATIKNEDNGTFCLKELRNKIRYYEIHEPITSLIVVENTHNICGGKVLPMDWLDDLAALVKEHNDGKGFNIALHMDGARVFNAAAELQLPVARIARDFDSICFCLSKGLSAPAGSLLLGTKAFISEAHRLRKALGGGMRQVGVLGAAGIVALDTVRHILDKDHARTKRIAKAIDALQSKNVGVNLATVQTNILLIRLPNPKVSSSDFANRLLEVKPEELLAGVKSPDNGKGVIVKVSSRNWEFARIVLYHQISDSDVDLIIKKFEYVIREYDGAYAA